MVRECSPLRKLASRNERNLRLRAKTRVEHKKPIGAYIDYEFECKILGFRRLRNEFLKLLVQPSSIYDL